ncbi:hypothetical protein Closa_3414 [[Clostridium] saccharolyticum WM1]|uniref:Uncharacterized protein n=1 Tax=Lacrimispora saccharolytica (strain ATCC 35040 / DSM 2544 / NRCC 2533 / WM1) TaxID=610130 RepID=D9R9W8_LACSW|nr:hypothetical protein [Lacrimispora saccharolytica]ADL05940.1 hypothetical protein Closa_3414 [[Clostridium] saccharolyticum WM1]
MTRLGVKIPLACKSRSGNPHDRSFSAVDYPKYVALKRLGRTKSHVQQNRYSWPGPGDLVYKGTRRILSDYIYIGID